MTRVKFLSEDIYCLFSSSKSGLDRSFWIIASNGCKTQSLSRSCRKNDRFRSSLSSLFLHPV